MVSVSWSGSSQNNLDFRSKKLVAKPEMKTTARKMEGPMPSTVLPVRSGLSLLLISGSIFFSFALDQC
jgi:hypothetical protein